jgi:inhibitor of cysteine peptidase
MKKALFILAGAILIAALGLAGAGCAPALTPTPTTPTTPTPTGVTTGTVEIHITDAPPREDVTSILVTASSVEIHKAVAEQEQEQQGEGTQVQEQEQQQVQEGEGEWLPLGILEGASTFDLLKIKGIDELFAMSEVEAGKYTQIRVTIEKVEVALGDEEPQEAMLPSGELKFVRPFDVVAGETTEILLDFDAAKSVNVTGSGKIIVRPVVKLTVPKGGPADTGNGIRAVSQEESQQVAEEFVRNDETFAFDGIAETLTLTETVALRSPYSWQFTFEFDSRQAGYGDRTGQVLAQVITHHQVVVTVMQGEVASAVMDEIWDMVEEQELNQTESPTGEEISIEVSYDDFMANNHITREVEATIGDSIEVTLASNPSTGFQWLESAQISAPSVLGQKTHKYMPPRQQDVVGAAGDEVWTFEALELGTTTVSMEYSQPWEGGEKGAWTFVLTVVIK